MVVVDSESGYGSFLQWLHDVPSPRERAGFRFSQGVRSRPGAAVALLQVQPNEVRGVRNPPPPLFIFWAAWLHGASRCATLGTQ